jgi:hypothetical protein
MASAVLVTLDKAPTPFADRLRCKAFAGSHCLIAQARGAAQHDPRSHARACAVLRRCA